MFLIFETNYYICFITSCCAINISFSEEKKTHTHTCTMKRSYLLLSSWRGFISSLPKITGWINSIVQYNKTYTQHAGHWWHVKKYTWMFSLLKTKKSVFMHRNWFLFCMRRNKLLYQSFILNIILCIKSCWWFFKIL